MRDSARWKYTERPRRYSTARVWWVAVCEGPEVIGVLEAASLAQAEQVAALRFAARQVVCRLWSGLTSAQRARARATLPETRLIPETEG